MPKLIHWSDRLHDVGACGEAVAWARTQKTAAAAWRACERADWMLWVAAKAGVNRRALVLCACDCARTALKYVPAGEERPRKCIETAEAWYRGEATTEEVRAARTAAAAAAAADDAAYAAYAAAYAAYAAAYAADAAAYAAAAYAATKVRTKALAEMAGIVRKMLTQPVLPVGKT